MSDYEPEQDSILPTAAPVQQSGAPSPAQAAMPAPMPQAAQLQKAVAEPGMFDAFKDPKFLTAAAQTYLDSGDENGLKWLEFAHNAVKENAVEAARHLIAGDGDAAVAAWNKSGRHTDAKSATPNGDGTWTITRAGGQTMQIDPAQEMSSLMSPEAFAQNQVAKSKAATEAMTAGAEVGLKKAQAGYFNDRTDSNERVAAMRADALRDSTALRGTAAAAQAKADNAEYIANQKYGTGQLYKGYLEKAMAAGDTNASQSAMAAVINTPGAVIVKPAPNGEIYLIDRKTNDMFQVLPNKEAYKAITGKDLYIPQGGVNNAAPAGVVRASQNKVPPPPAPAAGMTVEPGPGGGDTANMAGLSDVDLQKQAANVRRPQLAALARTELQKRSVNQGPDAPAQPSPADMATVKGQSLRDLQFLASQTDPSNPLIPAAKLELARRQGQ